MTLGALKISALIVLHLGNLIWANNEKTVRLKKYFNFPGYDTPLALSDPLKVGDIISIAGRNLKPDIGKDNFQVTQENTQNVVFNYGMRFYSGTLILNTRSVSGWDADVSLPFDVEYNVTFTLKVEIGSNFYKVYMNDELLSDSQLPVNRPGLEYYTGTQIIFLDSIETDMVWGDNNYIERSYQLGMIFRQLYHV
ncbi:hypothetical protein ACHWQZ_G004522 [Mnemiopsis leidyi]